MRTERSEARRRDRLRTSGRRGAGSSAFVWVVALLAFAALSGISAVSASHPAATRERASDAASRSAAPVLVAPLEGSRGPAQRSSAARLAATAVPANVPGVRPTAPRARPAAGRLLVADTRMGDPRFRETVILLATHDAGGSMGVVLNRPSHVPLHRVFEHGALADLPDRLFFGGPVDLGGVLYLMRSDESPEGSVRVVDDVHLSGDVALLREQFGRAAPTQALRVFTGYAGWAPGQLDGEISRGDWHILRATPEMIFGDPDAIWRKLWNDLSGIAI